MDRGLSEYRQTIDALFARTGATSKLGLERTLALLAGLGNPHRDLTTLHVAGTNGKGSAVATLYSLLRSKGMRVGRYTSPHLIDFRERIVVDDREISEADVLAFLSQWATAADRLGATFFEITTAMALDYFVRMDVDIAVIETGLGGRLDATNVITPVAAGITSIAIDHTDYLGTTIEEIAREKAGIFKPGVPSVIGRMPADARVAIERMVSDAGLASVTDSTRLYECSNVMLTEGGTAFTVRYAGEEARLSTGLIGKAQADNACVALAMLRVAGNRYTVSLGEAREVLPTLSLPGRFQRLGNYVLDVAHNPDGMRSLAATAEAVGLARPLIAVVGILADKNWREMLAVLSGIADHLILTLAPSAPATRAWNPAEALALAVASGWSVESMPDLAVALRAAESAGATVLVTGSFHTVGDALRIIRPRVP